MKKLLVLSAVAIAAAFAFHLDSTGSQARSDKFRRSSRPIPNRYIVVLEDTTNDLKGGTTEQVIADLGREFAGNVDKVYSSALTGYSVEMTEPEAQRLSEDARVKYIEQDSYISQADVQTNPGWGLDRIDQRSMPFDQSYSFNRRGLAVNVYVIDSGILTTHSDFQGRAFAAYDAVRDNTPIEQCNGHGTGVAGVVGGATFGVAKNVMLHSVRVLPCTGYGRTSDLISGVDWVTRSAVRPAVANISVQGALSSTINSAVEASIAAGVTYVISAGNNQDNACYYSPSAVQNAIVVGATTSSDHRVYYSNFGSCVDIFAPGEGVPTVWNTSNTTYTYASGTSFASPYAAGVAALFLEANPTASPQQVRDAIVNNATQGILSETGAGSPNALLFSDFAFGPPETPSCLGTNYAGLVPVPGAFEFQSGSSGFSSRSGRVKGTLNVASGSRFQLSLESKKGGRWTVVASSTGTAATETIDTRIKSGTFRWRVLALEGSGSYDLCSILP